MPDRPPVSDEKMLSGERWRKISWRRGTKGRLACLFAARRVRIAEGHKHRMLDKPMPHRSETPSNCSVLASAGMSAQGADPGDIP